MCKFLFFFFSCIYNTSDQEERTCEKCTRETRYECELSFTMEKQGRSILRTRYSRSPRADTYVHLASARAAFHSAGIFGAHVELTAINTRGGHGTAPTCPSLRLPRTRQKLAALPTGKTRSFVYRASPNTAMLG